MGIGPIGKYSFKNLGGNSPNKIIDERLKVGGSLFFPNDIGVHQFMMIFNEYDFKGEAQRIKESIVLPIPSALIDKYGMEYNQQELKAKGAGIASAAGKIIKNFNLVGTTGAAANEAETAAAMQSDQAKADSVLGIAAVARDELIPKDIENPLALATGTISNPHVALLFNSVNLKTFDFAWKLYPQDEDESNNLQEIIRVIKMRSHPTFLQAGGSNTNFIMKYPHEVDLYYLGQGDSMHRFKRAAITGLEINYAAEDAPAFFQGSGRPAFIELKLTFQETQIWTGEDFESEPTAGGSSEIGG